jgi:hypothetical protein
MRAHEVEQFSPELTPRDVRGYSSVANTNLTAVLVRALQEQHARLQAHEDTIAALRAEMGALRAGSTSLRATVAVTVTLTGREP